MAMELFNKANDEYISENYQRAVELYSEALSEDSCNDDILVNRAQAYLKLDQFQEAIADCDKALVQNSKNVKAYLRKGTALFQLGDYRKALQTFEESAAAGDDSNIKSWIDKCQAKLKDLESNTSAVKNTGDGDVSKPSAAAPVPAPAGPVKRRYDWYQTQTHVVVAVLQKNIKKEELTVNTDETSLKVHFKLPSGEDFDLDLHLAHPIVPEQTTTKVMASKVEIKLKKTEGIQWTHLEGDGQKMALKLPSATGGGIPGEDVTKRYPTSSHYHRNWDKLEQEVKEEEKSEKLEGDAALNKLFQQIYSDGSDEVKKAMMKSFSESGGTVLSTNWGEVGKSKVDVKPPDGMEFKKYEY